VRSRARVVTLHAEVAQILSARPAPWRKLAWAFASTNRDLLAQKAHERSHFCGRAGNTSTAS